MGVQIMDVNVENFKKGNKMRIKLPKKIYLFQQMIRGVRHEWHSETFKKGLRWAKRPRGHIGEVFYAAYDRKLLVKSCFLT
jgi:hypothetical protein